MLIAITLLVFLVITVWAAVFAYTLGYLLLNGYLLDALNNEIERRL